MSTPVVAGAVALLRQYFMQGFYPTGAAVAGSAYSPSGPLLKAVLLGGLLVPSLLRSYRPLYAGKASHCYCYCCCCFCAAATV